ncbi:hypothetical protein [Anaerolinea sp.]|uniref:hypothetical protein n=1 Tax=Anaerolinea sp. TaxID=1872519 RepID=UPI002ACE6DC6|nr:hypothetical protein [Anaerolinea sp.]
MSPAVVELQFLAPAPGGGEWRPGSLVVSGRTKWIIQKMIRVQDDDKVLVYLTRHKGRKVYLVSFVPAPNGWVLAGAPIPLPLSL